MSTTRREFLKAGVAASTAATVGIPLSNSALASIAAMEEGRAYVVVHTNDFDPGTPSGIAGDSPAGELRGAIE